MTPKRWPIAAFAVPSATTPEQWTVFSALLVEAVGVLGIEESPPAPNGVPTTARVFFHAVEGEEPFDANAAAASIREAGDQAMGMALDSIAVELVPDQDWGSSWRQYFRTLPVSERLWVGPPWEGVLPADAPAGSILVQIDPGQAFGTGSHDSTRNALRLLERHVKPGDRLLDVGTGSGILAIAAVKLGAAQVVGVEIDAVCEENFRLNASLNGVEDRLLFAVATDPLEGLASVSPTNRGAVSGGSVRPSGARPDAIDLILCNMLPHEFLPLLGKLSTLRAPMVLSGFLESDEPEVSRALEAIGFGVTDTVKERDWVGWLASPVG